MSSATPPGLCICVAWLCVHASSFTSVAASPTTTLSTSDIQIVENHRPTEEKVDITRITRHGSLRQCKRQCKHPRNEDPVCLKSLRSAKKEYICCWKLTSKYYEKECEEAQRNATDDVCSSDPCLHGGSCMIQHASSAQTSTSTDGYQCECEPSFTGQRCQTAIELAYQGCIQGQDGSGNCIYGKCYDLTKGRILQSIVGPDVEAFLDVTPQIYEEPAGLGDARIVLAKELTVMLKTMLLKTSVHKRPKKRPTNTNLSSKEEDERSVCYCDLGHMGFRCDLECPKRRWGPYCLGTCADKCITCSPKDGICSECYRGYHLSRSKRKCLRQPCDNTICIHGSCDEKYCICNDYYSGEWCDLLCSELNWPSFSKHCNLLCGRCITQPCDIETGECSIAQNGSRCMDGFRNKWCSELDIEGEGMYSTNVLIDLKIFTYVWGNLYKSTPLNAFGTSTELNEELLANQMLHRELDAHFMKELEQVIYEMHSMSLVNQTRKRSGSCIGCHSPNPKKKKNSTGKRIRRQSQSGQQDVPRLQIVISVGVPASKFGSASRAERYVKKKIKKTSDRFQSNVVPGLKIDKDSIKTRKVTLETTATQTTDTKWMVKSRYLLGGVIIAGGLLIFASLLLFVRKHSKQTRVMRRNRRSKFILRRV